MHANQLVLVSWQVGQDQRRPVISPAIIMCGSCAQHNKKVPVGLDVATFYSYNFLLFKAVFLATRTPPKDEALAGSRPNKTSSESWWRGKWSQRWIWKKIWKWDQSEVERCQKPPDRSTLLWNSENLLANLLNKFLVGNVLVLAYGLPIHNWPYVTVMYPQSPSCRHTSSGRPLPPSH